VLFLQRDTDVPGLLAFQIGDMIVGDDAVIAKLVFLVGKINLGSFEDLDRRRRIRSLLNSVDERANLNILGEVIVGVNADRPEGAHLVKGEHEIHVG
jgi:hypothetical protein